MIGRPVTTEEGDVTVVGPDLVIEPAVDDNAILRFSSFVEPAVMPDWCSGREVWSGPVVIVGHQAHLACSLTSGQVLVR